MDFLTNPVDAIREWLLGLMANMPAPWPDVIVNLLGVVVVASFGLGLVIILVWVERKVAARFQDRFGPNRVGPYGLFQTVADILKLFTKEDTTPDNADKPVYNLAPILSLFSVLLIWAVIPFSKDWLGTDLNVGVLYIVAVGSLGALAVLMAGWSSNNKFALLGAFRTVAQLVSYEVPLVISILIPVLLARSMGVHAIVDAQDTFFGMFFFMAPIAAVIFFISSIAEVGRTPFDLLEAESEIVAGFHIEYSGAKFAMIFAGEFLHAFTIAVLTATLFFGGWRGPGAEAYPILGWVYFMAKSLGVYLIVSWIRSTLPRIRIDHMLSFNWKYLTPLALATLIVTALLTKILEGQAVWYQSLVMFLSNVVLFLIANEIVKWRESKKPGRQVVGQPRPVARPPAEPAAEAEA